MARNPNQDANLKPIKKGELTKEEAKKRGSAGGKKSGEVRRAKRDARSAVRYMLNLPAKNQLYANLKELGYPDEECTNMAALQARMLTVAIQKGDLDAYHAILRVGGYDPEEIRKERESIASDRRREIELEAKVGALGNNPESISAAINMNDEDGNSDVVIYMPQLVTEESCQMEPEEKHRDKAEPDGGETEEETADK